MAEMSFKISLITNSRLQPHLPGANELRPHMFWKFQPSLITTLEINNHIFLKIHISK